MKKQGGNRFALAGNSAFILLPSAFPQRHGGDDWFSRPVVAGIFAQAGRDLTQRRKDARAQRKDIVCLEALRLCAFALKTFHRPLVDERGNVIGIVSAKLDASTALAMSGSLPENVNYAVKNR
jgi:hypothetical protein